MSLITRETARAMQAAGVKTKLRKRAKALTVAQEAATIMAQPSISASQRQKKELELDLDWITEQIRVARELNQAPKVLRLMGAKARLWQLLYPKPGSLKPKPERQRQAAVELSIDEVTNEMNHDEVEAANHQ